LLLAVVWQVAPALLVAERAASSEDSAGGFRLVAKVAAGDSAATTQPAERNGAQAGTEAAKETEERLFGLGRHESKHYVLFSNHSAKTNRDLLTRLERMFDLYRRQTAGYSKPITKKLVVCVFDNREDFVAAGGHPKMPGIYRHGFGLMVINHSKSLETPFLHLVRHEGWHQYVHQAVAVGVPIWVDEGLAEYLGYGIWTGDGYVLKVIRPEAFYSLKGYVDSDQLAPLDEFLTRSSAAWLTRAGTPKGWGYYMQAWSLVYFLRHGDDGKHSKLLDSYLRNVRHGRGLTKATEAITALNDDYHEWCRSLTRSKGYEHFYEAAVATLTSHLGRAHARGQRFASAADFLKAARQGKLKLPAAGSDQWLPPSLLKEGLWYLDEMNEAAVRAGPLKLTLDKSAGLPRLRLTHPCEIDLTGRFALKSGKVRHVKVVFHKRPAVDLETSVKQYVAKRKEAEGKRKKPRR